MTTTRRKLAIATWSAAREGNIYGKLTLDAKNALAYLDHLRRRTGEKVTMTHLCGKAVALALREAPTLNGRVALGRFIPHKTVDVTFLVALPGEHGGDLAKAKIERLDERPLAEVAQELRRLSERLRGGKDPDFEKSKGVVRLLPTWLLAPFVNLVGFLTGGLGISLPALGLEAFPFGSCIITSVGPLGLDEGFVPPTPFARVPVTLLVGAVRDRPAVVDGKLAIRPQLTLCATIDHRFIDGAQLAVLAQVVHRVIENPWTLDGLAGPPD